MIHWRVESWLQFANQRFEVHLCEFWILCKNLDSLVQMLQMLPCLVVYLHLQPALAAGKSGARKYHNISSCITICRILAKMHPHCKKLTLFRNIQIYWISCCQCIKKRLAIYSHTRSCIIHTSWARSKQMEQEQLQQKLKIVNVWIRFPFQYQIQCWRMGKLTIFLNGRNIIVDSFIWRTRVQ